MRSILITGASGLLGGNLALDYADSYRMWGVFHGHHLEIPGVRMIGADLAEEKQASMIMGKVKPDLVIHCAAATDIDRCQREPEWAFRLNRDMAGMVAKASVENGADLIHVSTDAVFSSDLMPHSEDEPASPNNTYGESKLAGEKFVLAAHPHALVVRTNLFGWNLRADKQSLAEWFLSNFSRGQSVNGFTDVFFSPILVNDLGQILLKLWRENIVGLMHVGGAECISKYEFGRRLAVAFGFDPNLVKRSSLSEVGLTAPRGKFLCLDSYKLENVLGMNAPGLATSIERFKALAPSRRSTIAHS